MPPIDFEWDSGNRIKSVDKHGVGNDEAESVFSDPHKMIVMSQRSSEIRFLCVGLSNQNRILTAYYVIRDGKVRIIGTRSARKREIEIYESRK